MGETIGDAMLCKTRAFMNRESEPLETMTARERLALEVVGHCAILRPRQPAVHFAAPAAAGRDAGEKAAASCA
jgi:hypothetical protein